MCDAGQMSIQNYNSKLNLYTYIGLVLYTRTVLYVLHDHVTCSVVHFGGYKVSHICDTEHKRFRINQNYSNFLLKKSWNYLLILNCT